MAATYPNIRYSAESQITPMHGNRIYVADDGLVRGYSRWSNLYYSLMIVHRLISAADAATLQSFVDTNVDDVAITFTDVNGDIYTCSIGSEPVIQPQVYNLWSASVNLIGVRS